MIHYFAYGSNMDLAALPARGVTVDRAEKGTLHDWKLVFNVIDDDIPGAGFANIEPAQSAQVEGIIYTIDEPSVAALDRYEDYPRDYDKVILPIQTDHQKNLSCLVYIGQPDRLQPHLKPTAPYLRSLLQGRPFLNEPYYARLQTLETLDSPD
jgi:cation transport regulator ChaC